MPQMPKDDMRGGEGGVAAQIHLHFRRQPAQIEVRLVRDDKRGLR